MFHSIGQSGSSQSEISEARASDGMGLLCSGGESPPGGSAAGEAGRLPGGPGGPAAQVDGDREGGVSVIPLCVSDRAKGDSGLILPLFCGVDTLVAMTNVAFTSVSWVAISRWLDNGRSQAGSSAGRSFVDADSSGHSTTHYPGAGAGLHNWYYQVGLLGGHVWISRKPDNGNVPNIRIKCDAAALAADGPLAVYDRVLQAVLCWGSSGHSGERVSEAHVACDFLLPSFDYLAFMGSSVAASVAGLHKAYVCSEGETVYLGKRGSGREWCVYGKGGRVLRGEDSSDWVARWDVKRLEGLRDVVRFEVRLRRELLRLYPGTVAETIGSLRSILGECAFGRVQFGDAYKTLQDSICGAFAAFASGGLGRLPYRSGARLDALQYLENRVLPALSGYAQRAGLPDGGLWGLLQSLGDAIAGDSSLREMAREARFPVESECPL